MAPARSCSPAWTATARRLTLLAGLTWREITVLRAYAKHMKQAAFTF
ncbi:NAD-glutamate dehydrogenase, partial [Aromatoleum toluclasticum]|nr:NAD-glutamate dehydrogenase [Aromatoleum toluclasticum]